MFARLLWLSSALCLCLHDCGGNSRFAPATPDPTRGTVTGTVICADTGKPARFATVELVRNGAGDEKSPEPGSVLTGLDGKFTIQGVPPGDYYAFATLDGYLDPTYGIDFDRIDTDASEDKLNAEMIDQWKEHMAEVSVSAHQTADVSVTIDRGAEITGTIAYDDGSPAAGLRFALYRRDAKGGLSGVGLPGPDSYSLDQKSGARGYYDIANLPAGDYVVCTLLPVDSQANSPQICFGNTFRRRDAKTLALEPGDVANGTDIVIPLGKIHSISGSLMQAVGTQPIAHAKIHLLYADDREELMGMDMFADGSFLFPFVPEGSYILKVTDGAWTEPGTQTGPDGKPADKVHKLLDRELPVTVDQDVSNLAIALAAAPEPPATPVAAGQPATPPPQ